MKFSDLEIHAARQLRLAGLVWEPAAGHYVLDETGFCKQPSPFQPNVYFILNYEYFMKTVGGVDRFKEIMTWLPTWHDCRQILEQLGVTSDEIATALGSANAIELRQERLILYQLIEGKLSG